MNIKFKKWLIVLGIIILLIIVFVWGFWKYNYNKEKTNDNNELKTTIQEQQENKKETDDDKDDNKEEDSDSKEELVEDESNNNEADNKINEQKNNTNKKDNNLNNVQNNDTNKKEESNNFKNEVNNNNNNNNKSDDNKLNDDLKTDQEYDSNQGPVISEAEKKNDELRKKIQTTYGVFVGYKDELDGNYVNNYAKPTKIYDDTEIYNHLVKINTALSKYPSSFFREIRNKWKPVTIYLVKSINGYAAGLTDNQNARTVIILINTGGLLFESTLHHEMMHYLDCYLANIVGAWSLENSIMAYNPAGFVYGNQNNNYVYRFEDPYYFLSAYAKSNYKEDRAVVFEDMMSRTWKREYYTKGNPINEKARVISEQLDTYLDSVSSSVTEYWERFVEF